MSTATDTNTFRHRILTSVREQYEPDYGCELPEQGEEIKKFAVVQTAIDEARDIWIELYDTEEQAIAAQQSEINSGDSRFAPFFIVDLDTGKARYTKMQVVITEDGADTYEPAELDDEDED